jgi:hypothetical protein
MFAEFHRRVVFLYEEVQAARDDPYQGIPRPHPDEPDPLYYAGRKIEQGLKQFDETFAQMSEDDHDVSELARAADSLMRYLSHAAEWFNTDDPEDEALDLPAEVNNVGEYFTDLYTTQVKSFYDTNISV